MAYVLDWIISLTALGVLATCAGALLLVTSDLDRIDPPDLALYTSAIILSAWLPIWFIYTCLSWTLAGFTFGMHCLRIRVTDSGCRSLGLPRAALRAGVMAVFSAPLLISPLLIVSVARFRLSDNPSILILIVASITLSAAACLPPLLGFRRGAWHDLVSGSQTVRDSSPSRSAQA